jgi:hypothetical protein
MFSFVLVEAIVIFIATVTLVKSFFNNQRRQLLIIISLAVGLFVPYTLVVNDLFNSFDILISITEFLRFPALYALLGPTFTAPIYKGFYLFLLLLVFGAIVYLLIFLLTRIVIYFDELRYQRFSSFAVVHKPWLGIPIGIIKAVLYVYMYLLLLSFLEPLLGIDFAGNQFLVIFDNLDTYVEYIINAAQQIRAPFN